MLKLSSPHCHTKFSDGRDTPEEMLLIAIEKGFSSIGFSDHAVQNFDKEYAISDIEEDRYILEIKQLKEKYKDKIAVYVGMERDCFSHADRNKYEYTIGSVHYIEIDGKKIAVDGNREKIETVYKNYFKCDGLEYAKRYYSLMSKYISEYKPDIIGHFDLLSKYNRQNELFNEESKEYKKVVFDCLDQIFCGCKLMEVNTGAIARSGATLPYPKPFILKRWHEMGGDVIFSSDCHNAVYLDAGYDLALQLIKKSGFQSIKMLSTKDSRKLFDDIEI